MMTRQWKAALSMLAVAWILAACSTIETLSHSGDERAMVDEVAIRRVDSVPPKYFAVVIGVLPDGCSEISGHTQDLRLDTIEITLFVRSTEETCSFLSSVPFKETIPLRLEEGTAGMYDVEVNGVLADEAVTIAP